MLLIDKPKTWSSFDVVNKLRWQIKNKLKVKKIKVGTPVKRVTAGSFAITNLGGVDVTASE